MLKKAIQYFLVLFYPLVKKMLPYQVYSYLATGALNTLLNISLFAVLYQVVLPANISFSGFVIASYTISLLIAFIVTVPTGFWLAKHFAFQQSSNEKSTKQLTKYFLVVSQGLISDYLLLKILVELLNFHPTVAKVISTVVVLTANYLLQKHFTFRLKKTA
jgi:putative flippase GtrA